RRAGTGPEPQRALSPPPAARALTRRARRTAVDLTDSLPTAHAVSRPPAGRDAMSPLRARLNRWLTHDRRVLLLALASGLPGTVIALALLWGGDFSGKVRWTLTLFIVALWWGVSFALRDRVVHPLQTLSNLLAALREEDFSIRARGQRRDDPLGEVRIEMNALADTLREQRLGALEATTLLRSDMEAIPGA